MSNEKIVLTKEGAEKLRAEYEDLVHNQRIAIASDVEAARAQGDLSENADYHASKDKSAEIDRRIRLARAFISYIIPTTNNFFAAQERCGSFVCQVVRFFDGSWGRGGPAGCS